MIFERQSFHLRREFLIKPLQPDEKQCEALAQIIGHLRESLET
jgi:hypothetical protein